MSRLTALKHLGLVFPQSKQEIQLEWLGNMPALCCFYACMHDHILDFPESTTNLSNLRELSLLGHGHVRIRFGWSAFVALEKLQVHGTIRSDTNLIEVAFLKSLQQVYFHDTVGFDGSTSRQAAVLKSRLKSRSPKLWYYNPYEGSVFFSSKVEGP